MKKINVIGDSLVDISFGLSRSYIHRYQQAARIELPFGDKLSTEGYELSVGGSGVNVAIGLSVAGFSPWFHTGLAPDVLGKYVREFLNESELELDENETDDQTPLSVILRVGGERTIITGRKGSSSTPTAIPNHGWIHLGPFHGSIEPLCSLVISQQIQTGQPLSLNPSIDTLEARERSFMTLLKTSEIIFLNLKEALSLTRMPVRTNLKDLLIALMRLGPKIACLTDGEKGAYVGSEGNYYYAPALADRNDRIDATGAGDAFTAGFLSGYLKGVEDSLEDEELLSQATAFAVANSASAVGEVGAHKGLLGWSEMEADAARVKIKRLP